MDEADNLPVEDVLFVALTRPAMKWGVPYIGCQLNLVGSFIVGSWLGVGSGARILLYFAALGISIHLAMRVLAAKDYYRFRALLLWLDTKGRTAASRLYGAATYSPLPYWPKRARELSISV